MSDFRARDADRARVVEVIETAFAGGRLGAEDRDLRIARARTAASLPELESLTRDLQVPDGPGVAPARSRPASTSVPSASRSPVLSRGLVLVLVAVILLATLLALGALGLVLTASP